MRVINSVGLDAGISATIQDAKTIKIKGPLQGHELQLITLTRPTAADIERVRAAHTLLVLVRPNSAARQAAQNTNHITLPNAGVRIVLPGLVLISPDKPEPSLRRGSPKLKGAAGRIIESLLLHPRARWTLRDLAAMADVSLGLTHRIASFLEQEGHIVERDLTGNGDGNGSGFGGGSGSGAGFGDGSGYGGGSGQEEISKETHGREVVNPTELLKKWAEDSHGEGAVFARGYMYSPNPFEAVRKVQQVIIGACVGSALAANSYVGRLSSVPPPYRVWIPESHASTDFLRAIPGLDLVNEGANLQFCSVRGDYWSLNATEWEGIKRVSRPRCYVELYESKGRMQELAEAVLESI